MDIPVTRTFDLLTRLEANHSEKKDILCRCVHGEWIKFSVKDYVEKSHQIAYSMLSMGYGNEDKAITICSNRPEWNILDLGLNLAKMVHVPVYSTLSSEEFLHIFNHSDAKIIFVGNDSLYKKIAPVVDKMDKPARVIMMDDSDRMECLSQLYKLGKDKEEEFKEAVEKIKKETSPNDLATIVYTSGTTGVPKGVMLSHWNLMFDAIGHALKQTVTAEQRMVSFLPLCHVYERTMNYEYQYIGISIYYAESLGTVARDLADCHADGFCGVPRVLEMMYSKFESAGKNLTGIKRIIYDWAWNFGNNFDNYNHKKLYVFKHNLADKLIYSKWREALGGHEMLVVSGGSSIQAKIVRLFNAAKLRIFEGYGMTETSPVIAVNSPVQGFNVIGTVGKKMEGTELKFAEDGEILTKGPHIMLGYYKDEEATKAIIDDEGFLHTGDIGTLVDGEYLKITDRKKEIFKLSLGKYVAPQVIENLLRESSYIENCMVVGENQKFASAIIIPDFQRLHFWAAKHKITYSDNDELIANPLILAKIHSEIEVVNAKIAPHERIKREKVINAEWTPVNNMLSQTLKLKRSKIFSKYKYLINDIYKIEN
jgi:long-chain acyl-CoA synthetase